jgi:hypothetical protein
MNTTYVYRRLKWHWLPLKTRTVNLQVSAAHAITEQEDSLPRPLKFIDRNLSWAA